MPSTTRLLAGLCVLAVVLAGCSGGPVAPDEATADASTDGTDTTAETTVATGTSAGTTGTSAGPEPHPIPLSVTNEADATRNVSVTFTDPDGTVVFERTVSLSSGEQVAYRYAVPADRVPAAGNATTYTLAVRFDDGRSASREYRVRRALLGVTVTLAGDGRVGFGQYVA